MVMLSAGSLSVSQNVLELLRVANIDNGAGEPATILNANSMLHVPRVLQALQPA
ncbi:MAG: hypothetical protein LH480_06290 [Rubrivivax sp.]|nr:hypothetical protein [Rubrivivax sp.]